jgi:hypothetical protein
MYVVNFTFRPLYLRGNNTRYALNRRLSRSGRGGENNCLCFCRDSSARPSSPQPVTKLDNPANFVRNRVNCRELVFVSVFSSFISVQMDSYDMSNSLSPKRFVRWKIGKGDTTYKKLILHKDGCLLGCSAV